jgi:tetratricopeptide (TPR) repeat protein
MKFFSTSEVANILSLTDRRVRSFVRAGFIVPVRSKSKTLQFNFRDLLVLKTAKSLLDSHIPAKRISRMLSLLRKTLPQEQDFSSLRIYADGQRIIVSDGKSRYRPDSGQFLFDFDTRSALRTVEVSSRKTSKAESTAHQWLNRAVELEKKSKDEALNAYSKALELDPTMNAARINLGRLCHADGKLAEAEVHYTAAAEIDPTDATPYFNLGVLLEDLKRPAEAIDAYRNALNRDPAFADAHYNLGLILDKLRRKKEAFYHLRTARKLYLGR